MFEKCLNKVDVRTILDWYSNFYNCKFIKIDTNRLKNKLQFSIALSSKRRRIFHKGDVLNRQKKEQYKNIVTTCMINGR